MRASRGVSPKGPCSPPVFPSGSTPSHVQVCILDSPLIALLCRLEGVVPGLIGGTGKSKMRRLGGSQCSSVVEH